MTIKMTDGPSAASLYSTVIKIRRQCDCGTDPDGYFTYTETISKGHDDHITKIPSQYFLGDEDIKIIKEFLKPKIGVRNFHNLADRRKIWWQILESEMFATFELTAPITFWAVDDCRSWFLIDETPVLDTSKYGKVSPAKFLESLNMTGHGTFSYKQLAIWWHNRNNYKQSFYEDLIPCIEQLPYADLFICNENYIWGAISYETT